MDSTHLAAFQQQLERLRAALLEQIAQQRGGTKGRAKVAAEHFARREDTSAQVTSERDLEFALNERETAELAALDAALARIASGRYGHCTDCDAAIPTARLQVTPEAARCITCQDKAEHAHI